MCKKRIILLQFLLLGYKTPNITQTLDICAKLGDYRLLICEYASNDIHKKILLNISKDELHYALQKIDFD